MATTTIIIIIIITVIIMTGVRTIINVNEVTSYMISE